MNWDIRYAAAFEQYPPHIDQSKLETRNSMLSVPFHDLWPHLQQGGMLHDLVRLYESTDPDNYTGDPRHIGIRRDLVPPEEYKKTMELIKSVHGKPNAMLPIYRAADARNPGNIYAGDWVTISPSLAQSHGIRRKQDGQFDPSGNRTPNAGDFQIQTGLVKASDLASVALTQQGAGWKRDENRQFQPGVIRAKHLDALYNPIVGR